jgi:hypothetical protein
MFDDLEFDFSDLELEVPEFELKMLKAPDLSSFTYARPTLEELRSMENSLLASRSTFSRSDFKFLKLAIDREKRSLRQTSAAHG